MLIRPSTHPQYTLTRQIRHKVNRKATGNRMVPHPVRTNIQKHSAAPRKPVPKRQRKRKMVHRQTMGSKTHYNHLENSTQNMENKMRASTRTRQSYTTNTRTTDIRKKSHSMLQLSTANRSKRQTHVRRYCIRNNAEKSTTN